MNELLQGQRFLLSRTGHYEGREVAFFSPHRIDGWTNADRYWSVAPAGDRICLHDDTGSISVELSLDGERWHGTSRNGEEVTLTPIHEKKTEHHAD